jgi:sodium pump decarboxylase gamma subunit
MGTVFLGLIALVFITKLIGAFFGRDEAHKTAEPALAASGADQGEEKITAAIVAAVLSALGTEAGNMRITKIQKQ